MIARGKCASSRRVDWKGIPVDEQEVRALAQRVAAGEMRPSALVDRVRAASVCDAGFAQLDMDRAARTGVPEVVYGAGKTSEQIAGIVRALLGAGQERVLVTRLDAAKAAQVRARGIDLAFDEVSRLGVVGGVPEADGCGTVLVVCAGTSDVPVAEEAAQTAEFLGNRVQRLTDVGVAGIHRLLGHLDDIQRARVIVAVAGMEGALASVVAGLASCPVIAVPTSVGYGASFGGVTALLAMLNSCASGVSVVNIDNGFGAAFQASLINHLPGKEA